MAADDLNAPLGSGRSRRSGKRRSVPVMPLITGFLAAVIVVGLFWIAFVDDPLGGEPVAVAAIDAPAKQETAAPPDPDRPAAKQESTSTSVVTIIDGKSGVRTEVPVSAAQDESLPARSLLNERLVEMSPHGPIPRVAADGSRPLDAYAHAGAGANGEGPRIAIVVNGLGVGAQATSRAIASLPSAVTFAFAPYGTEIERWTALARGKGHELLLQIPMEPFDYPDNDPGPRTLLANLDPEQNLDRLHWFLSRAQGYVGVTHLMGERFTASEAALTPMLADLTKRGLLYFDNAASPRSVAGKVADRTRMPFLAADLVVDATPAWPEIDAALERLERIAAERGFAVGSMSALPVSIERLARWIKAAEARGIRLVPLSAIAVKSRPS